MKVTEDPQITDRFTTLPWGRQAVPMNTAPAQPPCLSATLPFRLASCQTPGVGKPGTRPGSCQYVPGYKSQTLCLRGFPKYSCTEVSHGAFNEDVDIDPHRLSIWCPFLEAGGPSMAFQKAELLLPLRSLIRPLSQGLGQCLLEQTVLGGYAGLHSGTEAEPSGDRALGSARSTGDQSLITGLHSPHAECWCWIPKCQRKRTWR